MKKVNEITADTLGKVVRLQTADGAYIEGTLTAVVFASVGKVVEVMVTFQELTQKIDGRREPMTFLTYPNRNASEVEEEYYGPSRNS